MSAATLRLASAASLLAAAVVNAFGYAHTAISLTIVAVAILVLSSSRRYESS